MHVSINPLNIGPTNIRKSRFSPLSAHKADSVLFSGTKLPKLTYEQVGVYDVDYLGRVNQYRFSNGLEAYIIQDKDAEDLVSYGVAVKTGSINETLKTEGMAHFFEHEIFKGTHEIGPMKAPKILQGMGAGVNAFTSNDATVYHGHEFEKKALPSVIKLWTEMLLNHGFPEEFLNRERGVVIEEIKRSKNNKQRVLYEALNANVWAGHRYGRTVLGPIKNIANIPLETMREYYQKYYAPSNQAAIALGNFDPQDITKILDTLAEEYAQTFDAIPAKKLPKLPPRQGEKNILLREKVSSALMIQAFDGPVTGAPNAQREIVALDLLTNILGAGGSSRLHQRLVEEKQQAHMTVSYLTTNAQRSKVDIYAQTDPDKLETLKASLAEEIQRIVKDGISQAELDEACLALESQLADVNESQEDKLGFIGRLVVNGRLSESFGEQLKLARQLTPSDIQAVTQKYLSLDKAYTASLVPQDYPVQPYEKTSQTKRPKFGGALGACERSERLRGGAELVVREKPGTRKKTAISLLLQGGNRADTIPGVTQLLAKMLERGTMQLSAAELQKRLGRQKLELEFNASADAVVLTIDGLKQFTPQMFEILNDIARNPGFREEDLTFVKKVMASKLKQKLETQAQFKIADLAIRALYDKNHPYDTSAQRMLDNMDKITLDDIRKAHQQLFTQGNMTLSVVGDTTLDAVRDSAQKLVSQFPEGRQPLADAPKIVFEKNEVIPHVDNSLSQAEIKRVWHMPDSQHEDYAALKAMNFILSGGFARLFMTFRESGEKGLCYTASSNYVVKQQDGEFGFYIGTDPENINKVLKMFQDEMDLLLNQPVPPTEWQDQLTYLKATIKSEEQKPSAVSNILASHRSFDNVSSQEIIAKLEQVTVEDIQRVARKYLTQPSKTVVLAPEKGLKEQGLL